MRTLIQNITKPKRRTSSLKVRDPYVVRHRKLGEKKLSNLFTTIVPNHIKTSFYMIGNIGRNGLNDEIINLFRPPVCT